MFQKLYFSLLFSPFFLLPFFFLFQDFTRSIFGREAFVKSLYPLPLSPFISFQIFTRSIFRRVFSKDYDRIDLNAFLVRLARLLNRLFFLPSRNPSLIDRSLTISNLHLPPFPINSPLQIAPSQCFKLRRCKNTTKPSLRFLLINLSKRKRKKENNGAENKNRTLYPENRERNIYIYRKIGRFQKINVERGGAEMLSKREKEKKIGGQSQHFIYYYYPSTKKTHSPPPSSPFKSGQESPLLSSPLLCSPPPLCRRFFRSPGLAARS